jgi:hypothetical protein
MSDIVERLRSGEDGLEYAAADEIERLLEILSSLIDAVDWANSALARGDDEQWIHHNLMKAVGKAREALEK